MRRFAHSLVPAVLALLLLAGPAFALRGGHGCSMADCAMHQPMKAMAHCGHGPASLELDCCPPPDALDPVDANVAPAPTPHAVPSIAVAAVPVAARAPAAAPAPAPPVPRWGRALLSLHQTFLI